KTAARRPRERTQSSRRSTPQAPARWRPRSQATTARQSASRRHGFGRENVAAAPHRLDQARIARVGLDLPAQPADRAVDAAIEAVKIASLGDIQKLVPR